MTITLDITIPRILVAFAILGPSSAFIVFNHFLNNPTAVYPHDNFIKWGVRAVYFCIAIFYIVAFALFMKA